MRRTPQTFSLGELEIDFLKQLSTKANEPMSVVIRDLIKEEARKHNLKPTPPDPLAAVPSHIPHGDRTDILNSLNRGCSFEEARHLAGFNPDWTLRDD
jgi:hypothetical protein